MGNPSTYPTFPPNPYSAVAGQWKELDIPRVALIVMDTQNSYQLLFSPVKTRKPGANLNVTSNKTYYTKGGFGLIPFGGRWNVTVSGIEDGTQMFFTVYDLVDNSLAKSISDIMGLISDVNVNQWGGAAQTGE